MTTWTISSATAYSNLAGAAISPLYSITDGTYIYGIQLDTGNYYVCQYDPGTNIVTKITSLAGNPPSVASTDRLTWFKGRLYYFQPNFSGTSISVWRWSGSGTAWSLMKTFDEDDFTSTTGTEPKICGDSVRWGQIKDSELALCMTMKDINIAQTCINAGNYYTIIFTTSDGANWSTLEIGSTSAYVDDGETAGLHGGLAHAFRLSDNDFWVDGVQVTDVATFMGVDKNFLWKDGNEYDTDGNSWTALSDATLTWMKNHAAWPVAWWQDTAPNPNELYLAYWQPGGDFDATRELVATALPASTITGTDFIRLDNGLTLCGALRGGGGGPTWYVRDDNLGMGTYPDEEIYDLGQFYYGRGELRRRSDALIPSTNPGGLALVGKKLFAGSNVDNPIMVAYAQKPTYEAWTDYTGTLSKITPIKSFSATPWGDSEDLEGSEGTENGGAFQGGTGGKCS